MATGGQEGTHMDSPSPKFIRPSSSHPTTLHSILAPQYAVLLGGNWSSVLIFSSFIFNESLFPYSVTIILGNLTCQMFYCCVPVIDCSRLTTRILVDVIQYPFSHYFLSGEQYLCISNMHGRVGYLLVGEPSSVLRARCVPIPYLKLGIIVYLLKFSKADCLIQPYKSMQATNYTNFCG